MTVLICKNIESEGPGTIGDFLGMKGIAYRVVELPPAEGYGTLVMMGGPMSVNEGRLFPCITREIELAREFIARRKPVLGICVGAQSTVAGPLELLRASLQRNR